MLDKKKGFFFKKYIFLISILVGFAALVYIFKKISFNEVFSAFHGNVTWFILISFLVIEFFLFLSLTYRWHVVLRSQNVRGIGLFNLFNYKLVGYAISYLTPSAKIGGEPIRAGLLSSRHNVNFNKALSSVVIDKTLELTCSALFFVLGGIYILFRYVVAPELKSAIILISILFVLVFGLFNYRLIKGKSFFHRSFGILGLWRIKKLSGFSRKLKDLEELVIKFYHEDRKYFFYSIIISFASWVFMFFQYMIIGKMIGVDLTPVQIFLVFSFVGVSYLVPIPMALGSLEAGQISLFKLIKISSASGVALSLVVRLTDILLSVLGLILLAFYGLRLKEVVKDAKRLDKEVERLKGMEKLSGKKIKKSNSRGR